MAKKATSKATTLPMLKPGYTVRVHWRVLEGEKERLQTFEGLIIALHRGRSEGDRTVTLRSIVEGIALERIVPLGSPLVRRIDVLKEANVRRAKLTFLRTERGKTSRLRERFLGVQSAPPPTAAEEAPQAA